MWQRESNQKESVSSYGVEPTLTRPDEAMKMHIPPEPWIPRGRETA
jgi:hypothetical protein